MQSPIYAGFQVGARGYARQSFFWYENDQGLQGPFRKTQPI